MLKPIHRVPCSPALAACKLLMQRFALWLCDPTTTGANVTLQGLQPPVLATAIEANWLWSFLQREINKRTLIERAQTVANMSAHSKTQLTDWINSVSALPSQFLAAPLPWPITQPVPAIEWTAFRELFEAFYEKGFRSGLPFLENGSPTVVGGVTYANYVESFRNIHRMTPHPDAYEICVLCGNDLGDKPEVDHWIIKSAFPLLSMCQDNLTLICNACNSFSNKGYKPVHTNGSFAEWFHPYLRPGNGILQLGYDLPSFSVKCTTANAKDQPKVDHLDSLLNLTSRWTKEFKAQYARQQDILIRREQKKIAGQQNRHTLEDIQTYVAQWNDDLNNAAPHFEVHEVLAKALLEPSRLKAWHDELRSIT
ncbi:hypothetical protein VCSRO97_3368 [Vibrio cholerae]|nr:hypothetical protein VCSRO97_3368 [Vibrio cholerae]